MTALELIPIHAELVKAYYLLSVNAQEIINLKSLTYFPIAYKLNEKISVKKQDLESHIAEMYGIPIREVQLALTDLQNDGIVKIHTVGLKNERMNYVEVTSETDYLTKDRIATIFNGKVKNE